MAQADHLVLIFPIWWELMPALTKGFVDKVIYPGVAYDYDTSGRWPRMIKRWHNRFSRLTPTGKLTPMGRLTPTGRPRATPDTHCTTTGQPAAIANT